MELEGRVAVVTGGGSGLGAYVVRELAAAGCHVVVGDRDDAAAAGLAAEVRAGGGAATGVRCDVTRDDDLRDLVAAAERLGRLDVLVNNAGGWGSAAAQYPEAAPADWTAVLDLNLRAPMLALQLALPLLRAGGGAVVNVASSAGVEETAYGSPPYAASKAGLVRLTTSLAGLASDNVRVTCVVPGWVGLERAHTERAALDPAGAAAAPALVPPELVASTVVRLVLEDAPGGTVVELLDGDQVVTRGGTPST